MSSTPGSPVRPLIVPGLKQRDRTNSPTRRESPTNHDRSIEHSISSTLATPGLGSEEKIEKQPSPRLGFVGPKETLFENIEIRRQVTGHPTEELQLFGTEIPIRRLLTEADAIRSIDWGFVSFKDWLFRNKTPEPLGSVTDPVSSILPEPNRRRSVVEMLMLSSVLAFFFAFLMPFILRIDPYAKIPRSASTVAGFQTFGEKSNPSLVLIPGLDGATSFFSDAIPILSSSHHVVMYNLPLARGKGAYTFSTIVDDLMGALDQLQLERVVLVGESFGGVVSQHAAMMHHNRVDGMVLLSSLAKTDLPADILWKLTYLLPVLRGFGIFFPSTAQSIFAHLHVPDVVEPTEPQWVKDLFIKEAAAADFDSVMARIDLVRDLDIEKDVREKIPKELPVLCIFGEDDHFTRKSSEALFDVMKGRGVGSRQTVRGMAGGHLPHITSPKVFADFVSEFVLREVYPVPPTDSEEDVGVGAEGKEDSDEAEDN